MSLFNLVGIFFLRHSEEVSVDLFNFTVCGLAEKDEDVIALGEFSCLDRQRSEPPIFAAPDFTDPAAEDFPPFERWVYYLVVGVSVVVQFHQHTRFSG